MENRAKDTKVKALEINLDPNTYGSLAEIGAGQEVAAFLFKAGAASGTIAKTMSAYDMTFSDTIYGKETDGRYVCESRLIKMLNREFTLLENRLKDVRQKNTLFFAFADTVVTINYNKSNQGHGWIGLRFQLTPGGKPNDLIVHIRLMKKDSIDQQQAVGIFGINMIYGCFYYAKNPERLLDSLMDNLSTERIKIDMIRFSGPDFSEVDNRIVALQLVQKGYTNAVLFDTKGQVREPADVFHKKNILALRSRFRPPTHVNMDMLRSGYEAFIKEPDVKEENVIKVGELTLNNLRAENGIDYKDFLDRVDIMLSLGENVLISNYQEYYRLIDYFSRFTKFKIGIILGPFNLMDIFNENYYTALKGGILESFGALFSKNVKLFVYPSKTNDGNVLNGTNLQVPPHLFHLYQYLLSNGKIQDIENYKEELLHIYSDNVIRMIHENNSGWEQMVPEEVVNAIKNKKLFGYAAQVN